MVERQRMTVACGISFDGNITDVRNGLAYPKPRYVDHAQKSESTAKQRNASETATIRRYLKIYFWSKKPRRLWPVS